MKRFQGDRLRTGGDAIAALEAGYTVRCIVGGLMRRIRDGEWQWSYDPRHWTVGPPAPELPAIDEWSYEICGMPPPAPRDYRAERDALRLRLDEALDEIARLRSQVGCRSDFVRAEAAFVAYASRVAPLFGTRTP